MLFDDDDSAFPLRKGENNSTEVNSANMPGSANGGEPAGRFTFRQAAEVMKDGALDDREPYRVNDLRKASETKVPENRAQGTKVPENGAQETKVPENRVPEIKASVTEASKAKAPVTVMPEAKKPEAAVSQPKRPDVAKPEVKAPQPRVQITRTHESILDHKPEIKKEKIIEKNEKKIEEKKEEVKKPVQRKKDWSEFYEPKPTPEVKREKRRSKGLIAFVAVVTALAVAYVVMAVVFRSHIFFRTTIDGVDCSFKSVDAVSSLITEKVDDYELNIKTIEGVFYKIRSSDIDLKCNVNSDITKLCQSQPIFTWPVSLFKDTNLSVELKVDYNKEKLKAKLESFGFLNAEKMTAPVEAKLTGYNSSTGFEVQKAVLGNTINESVFITQLRKAILSLDTDLDLKESNCYVQPLYTEDSEDFQLLMKQAEHCVGSKITYTFGGMNETITIKEFLPWLTMNDNKELTIDDDSLLEYVNGIASKYTSTNDTRAFMTSYGEVVNIPARTYGFQVDVEGEANKLKEDILSGNEVSRGPVFVDTSGNGVKDFGNSYVEINLGMQHLFLYVNGERVFECDIVSGLPSTGAATPPGIFAIYYCKRNAILRGPGYASPVSYWMPFNGGIGIHDATWQPRFGYDRYLRNGSHGCINVSLDSAATIFSYVSAGFPVIVYQYGTATPEPGVDYAAIQTQEQRQQQQEQEPDDAAVTEYDQLFVRMDQD